MKLFYSKYKYIILSIFILLVILISVATAINKQIIGSKGDIDVFINASKLLLEGRNFYSIPNRVGLVYIYTPLLAVILIPFTILPIDISIVLWTFLSIALVIGIFLLFFKTVSGYSFRQLPQNIKWALGIFSIGFSLRFILHHLDCGQSNLYVLGFVILGIYLISIGKNISGGFAIGISIVLKLITIPFGWLYILKLRYKILIGILVGLFLGLIFPSMFIGWDKNYFYLSNWFNNFVLNTAPGSGTWAETTNSSIQALLYRLFTDSIAFKYKGIPYSITLIELPVHYLKYLGWFFMLVILLLILWYNYRYKKSAFLINEIGGVVLVFSLIPLFSTITEKHHLVILIPAHIFVVYVWQVLKMKDRLFLILLFSSFILLTLTTDGIWGRFLSEIFTSYGSITIGNIFLVLAILRSVSCLEKLQ